MAASKYPVRVNGYLFRVPEQVAENKAWSQALAFAHRKEMTECCCVARRPVRLVVRRYGADGGAVHYGLARWKGTGLDHHPDCQYFGEEAESYDVRGALPAYEEMEGDLIRVHLARPLAAGAAPAATVEALPTDGRASLYGRSRSRAPDISVLLKLWREARLNVYSAKDVSWFMASLRVLHTAKRMVIDRKGRRLADILMIGAHASNNTASTHNAEVLASASAAKTRLFIIGRLRAPTPEQLAKRSFLLPLLDFHGLPKALVDPATLDRLLGRRPVLQNLIADRAGNVVVICCIEPNGGDWWKVIDIAGFGTSPDMIPVESGFELQMERHLAACKRRFLKPLQVGETENASDQRPDFLLLDTLPRVMIEVWGMQTPEYLESKRRRLAKYAAARQPVISWSPDRGDPLPTLPPASDY